jgi:hypothetical protein
MAGVGLDSWPMSGQKSRTTFPAGSGSRFDRGRFIPPAFGLKNSNHKIAILRPSNVDSETKPLNRVGRSVRNRKKIA